MFPSSSAIFDTLIYRVSSINDQTVPYMTAYVDLEDPFLNSSDELSVYGVPQSTDMHADSPPRNYDDKYFPIMKSFTILDIHLPERKTARPSPWAWLKSYNPPLPPRFQGSFPYNIVRVHPNISEKIIQSVLLTDYTRIPPYYLPCLHLPCSDQSFHLLPSFSLAHQAPRV